MIFRKNSGFTLIELLIVIALIGVLAVALLSTINPVEQTRKAKDSARKAAAAELLNSAERFQATFFCYPWSYETACEDPEVFPVEEISITDLEDVLVDTSSEMKPEFFHRDVIANPDEHPLILSVDDSNLAHICFVPESQTFIAQADKSAVGIVIADGTHVCVPE